jgi:hypothetical protein
MSTRQPEYTTRIHFSDAELALLIEALGTAIEETPADREWCADAAQLRQRLAGRAGLGPVPLASEPGATCPDPYEGCGHDLTVHSADLGCWRCDCTYGRGPDA